MATTLLVAAMCCNISIAEEPDSVAVELESVSVVTRAPQRILRPSDGRLVLTAADMAGMPQVFGADDPIRMMQALPAVRTSNDLNAGISIQGCSHSYNHTTIDGAGVTNPSHLLGLFSIFNTPHFSSFSLKPSGHRATASNFIGGAIEAATTAEPDTLLRGTVTAGLIESHATVAVPLRRGSNSITVSARQSYVDKVFPSALKIDHARIAYSFGDVNATFTQRVGNDGIVKANLFYSHDRMDMHDGLYDSDGRFRWSNIMGSASYADKRQTYILSASRFQNRFRLRQTSMELDLPSALTHLSYTGTYTIGTLTVGAEGVLRICDEQAPDGTAAPADRAGELSVSATYRWQPHRNIDIEPGIRATLFTRSNYTRLYPMPRLAATYHIGRDWHITATYGMYTQFTHLIEESGTGMPTDFWINASQRFRPLTSHAFSLSATGVLPGRMFAVNVEAYCRLLNNVVEYNGALLNMVSSRYHPLDDVLTGRGRAYGVSVALMKNTGHLRGWVGYNIGRSESRFDALGNSWHPASHDRLHDLTAMLSWQFPHGWSVGASFVHATGTPYTEASYGYMIGENLICEYLPHNSNRLPDYNRLDLSADWRIPSGGRVRHRLGISLYNALWSRNVLFQYVAWSAKDGLIRKQSVMASAIPAITYTISF